MMRAAVGARIVVCGHRAGWPDRECEVVQVRSASGGPPYLVRWAGGASAWIRSPGQIATGGGTARAAVTLALLMRPSEICFAVPIPGISNLRPGISEQACCR